MDDKDIWSTIPVTGASEPEAASKAIIEPPKGGFDKIPSDEPQDIVIGAGAKGTEQKAESDYLKKGYEVDQLNNLRFSGQRKKNFI